MSLVRKIHLHDGNGNSIGSINGAIGVYEADVRNQVVNKYMHLHSATSTTLTAAVVSDGSQ